MEGGVSLEGKSGGLLLPGAPRAALAYLSSECVLVVVRT